MAGKTQKTHWGTGWAGEGTPCWGRQPPSFMSSRSAFLAGLQWKKKVKPPLPHPPIPSSRFEEWICVEIPFSSPDNLLNFITVITGDEFSQSCLGWPWLGQWPAHLSSFSLWIILGKKDNGQEMQKSLFSPQDNPALIPQEGQLWAILNQGHCCSRLN